MALRLAKEAARIAADKPFKLTLFPREKSTLETFYDRLVDPDRDSDAAEPTAAQGAAARLARLLSGIEALLADPGILRMPALGEIR